MDFKNGDYVRITNYDESFFNHKVGQIIEVDENDSYALVNVAFNYSEDKFIKQYFLLDNLEIISKDEYEEIILNKDNIMKENIDNSEELIKAQKRAYKVLKSKTPYAVIYGYSQGKGDIFLNPPLIKNNDKEIINFINSFKKSSKQQTPITLKVFYSSQLDSLKNEFEAMEDNLNKKNDNKELLKENMAIDLNTRRELLAKYLKLDIDKLVDSNSYQHNCFENIDDNSEYLVLTDDEAYDSINEHIVEEIDAYGIGVFTDSFKNWIIENALLNNEYFEDVVADMFAYDYNENFTEDDIIELAYEKGLIDKVDNINNLDIDVDTLIERLIDLEYEYIDDVYGENYYRYLVDIMGKSFVEDGLLNSDMFKDSLDIDKIVDEAIRLDGRGHFLASYDGKEIELDDDLYAYRIN